MHGHSNIKFTKFIFCPDIRLRLRTGLSRELCRRLSQQHVDFLRRSEHPFTDTQNELERDLSEHTRCVQVSYSGNLLPALLRTGDPASLAVALRKASGWLHLLSPLLFTRAHSNSVSHPSYITCPPPNFAHFYPQNGDRNFVRNEYEPLPEYKAS